MTKTTIGYLAIVILLLTTSFFSLNLFLRQRTECDELDIRIFPHTVGDWKGRELEITESEYDILETRNLISREYVNSSNQRIYLFIIYSETNRLVFHPPEVCLIGSGVTITDKKSENINFERKELLTNKLYLEKNNIREVALYCYKSGNFYTDNYWLQQAHFAFNQLLCKHKGGATIRVSMPVVGSEEVTLAVLKKFMAEAVEALEQLSSHHVTGKSPRHQVTTSPDR